MGNMWFYICVFVLIQQTLVSVANAKFRRGPFMGKCCNVEKTPADIERDELVKKIRDECVEEIGGSEEKPKDKRICFSECMANKANVLNEDKSLNEDAFKDYLVNKIATSEYQKAVAADTATKCIEFAKESSEKTASGCSKIPQRLMVCVAKEVFNACPEESRNQSETCMKIREAMSKPDSAE